MGEVSFSDGWKDLMEDQRLSRSFLLHNTVEMKKRWSTADDARWYTVKKNPQVQGGCRTVKVVC